MSYYINDKVVRTLPEQVAQNQEDITNLAAAQDADHDAINTNTNNIAALDTRVASCESTKLQVKDGAINLCRSNKADMGTIAVKTLGGNTLLESGNIPVATINGESILQTKDFTVDANLSTLLWANLGIGRWANQTFYTGSWSSKGEIYDNLAPYYTNISRYLDGATYKQQYTGADIETQTLPAFSDNVISGENVIKGSNATTLILDTLHLKTPTAFVQDCPNLKQILVKSGSQVSLTGVAYETFKNLPQLEEIGEITVSALTDGATYGRYTFYNCPKLKAIHCKHWTLSFNIATSTAFEQADLVEIISNLDAVSNGAVLTMGATNLAKLTAAQISVATGKGWTLA